MTRQEAGRKGGKTTVDKHGRSHMREIGRKGAQRFWKLYKLVPLGTADFAIVRRSDGKQISTTRGYQ